jgi:hypothetical protein
MMDIRKIIDTFYTKELDWFPESGSLEALYQMEIWDNLNGYEKVDKIKSKIYYYEKHSLISKKEFDYEEAVIKVTEFILSFLQKIEDNFRELESIKGLDAYIFRIRNLLFCEKALINRNISLRYINHVLLELLEPLIEKIKGVKEYEIYGLDEFLNEYKNMLNLLKGKPYDE